MTHKICLVLVPATAASVVLAFGLVRASGLAEVGLLLASAGLLLIGHRALLSRALRRRTEEEARRARSELDLQARVTDCERRRASLAAFSRLAAHVAHEVRNPLASIGLNLELLEEEMAGCACPANPAVQQLLRAIQGETDRLQKLTDEYLAFARPRVPVREAADLAGVVRELGGFVGPEAAEAGVTLRLDLPRESVPVAIDRQQLRQAVLNLVRNALQAMPGGGTLRLAVTAGEGRVRLEVEDSGPGVPAEARCRIFEPFYTTKASGTGLGLPLALQIAREHGGDLTVEERDRAGACFTLSLPLAPPPGSLPASRGGTGGPVEAAA